MTLRFLTLVLCISAQLRSAQKLEKWTQLTATGEFNPLTESASVFIFIDEKADTAGNPIKDCFSCTFFDQTSDQQQQIERLLHKGNTYCGPELYHANQFAPDMLTRFLAFQKQTGNWLNMQKETLETMLSEEEKKITRYKKLLTMWHTAEDVVVKNRMVQIIQIIESNSEKHPDPFKAVFLSEFLALKKADLDGTEPSATPFISALQHRCLLQNLLTLKPTSSS